jgi:hypothetical protein
VNVSRKRRIRLLVRTYLERMTRILALTGVFAVLVGTSPAAAAADMAPRHAGSATLVSPAARDDLPTAAQMRAALLTAAELPSGYTGSGEILGTTDEVPGSGRCREGIPDRRAPMAQVRRTFEHTDGSTIDLSITATGSRVANAIVTGTATAPTRCPVVVGNVTTKKHSRLPLPDLGAPSAGLVEMFQDYVGEWGRYSHVVVASGEVTAIFTEIRGSDQSRLRFLTIVKAGATKLLHHQPPDRRDPASGDRSHPRISWSPAE